VILSSPSGAGKTSIAKRLCERRQDVQFSVSATTRPARKGENDGVHYHFLTRDEFLERRERGEFLESAEYSGHFYGTLNAEVDSQLAAGKSVLLDIDPQGARQVRERRSDVVAIFVLPPSGEALLRRLEGRSSEAPKELARRLSRAGWELEQALEYDYVIVNDELEAAVEAVSAIMDAEPHRADRVADLGSAIEALRRDLAARARTLMQ
jgi:guanylate kinase